MLLILVGVLAIVLAGLIYIYARLPPLEGALPGLRAVYCTLSEEERAQIPYPETYYPGGAYITLRHGDTRYYVMGPEDGPRIVLIHGLQWPSPIWDKVARGLFDHGYRILVYDLYGRGYSDGPSGQNNTEMYVEQLQQLLAHIGWTHVTLIGLSMGGGIAISFANAYPEQVMRLVLLAPSGLLCARFEGRDEPRLVHLTSEKLFIRLAKRPFLLRMLMCLLSLLSIGAQLAVTLYRAAGSGRRKLGVVAYQLAYSPAAVRSIVLSLRDFPLSWQVDAYRAVGQRGTPPTLAIWGTADVMIPYSGSDALQRLIPHAQLVTLVGAGHDLTLSHAEDIVQAMDYFITQP